MVLRHSRYPPILRTDTRTLAAPFKEQHTHRSSCQSVGNNYSPLAQDLKMVQLHRRPLTVRQAAALRILPTGFVLTVDTFIFVGGAFSFLFGQPENILRLNKVFSQYLGGKQESKPTKEKVKTCL